LGRFFFDVWTDLTIAPDFGRRMIGSSGWLIHVIECRQTTTKREHIGEV